MRESHRARTMFRKVDGFRYIMSVIVSMNGCLGADVKAPWSDIDKKAILTLLQCIFCTLTVAMRYEPTNIKFFKAEVSILFTFDLSEFEKSIHFLAYATFLATEHMWIIVQVKSTVL